MALQIKLSIHAGTHITIIVNLEVVIIYYAEGVKNSPFKHY
jgi:hypothetical protein